MLLGILADTDIDGVGATHNFISRRIQSCMERVHRAYEYWDADFVREAPKRLTNMRLANGHQNSS